MSERSSWQALQGILMGSGWFVGIACQIALIVIVATVVRRHRPDAWQSLLAWAITSAATVLFLPALHYILMFLVARNSESGIEGIFKVNVINQAISIPLHIVVFILLARGLVRIAQPAPKPDVGPTPPYR